MTLTEAYGPPWAPRGLTAYRYAYRYVGRGTDLGGDLTISQWHFIPVVRFEGSPHVEVWHEPRS